ncbi:helix-turn-helix domain-containing protein [Glycomyces sp. MUSA5-2]|uniref:helix-turn-helix domain-containing protein n=1 Tax=Glycomyces sp. MUSA5-2 TaxID=2053002 RepID=UPI003FA60A1C
MGPDTELGCKLKQQRTSASVTLAQVAHYAHCSVSHLSNVEAGRRTVYPEVLSAYERAIREATDMRRRTVVTGVAGALLAPQATSELLRNSFSERLGATPSGDDWEERLIDLGRSYMSDGATVVQERLAADLTVLQHATDSPHMWSVAARGMAIYGKTTKGPKDAIEWYRLAESAALRSDDINSRVWVAGRAALALGYEGAATPTALAYAEQAIGLANGHPTSGLLNAQMGRAHALASSGRADEARATWDDAQRTFEALSPDDEITDFNYPFWRFAVVGSLLHARLGDSAAEHWQDEVDAHRPASMVRFITHVELHRALMMARSGDYAGGVAYGEAALEALPADKRSQSLYLMLDEIKQR